VLQFKVRSSTCEGETQLKSYEDSGISARSASENIPHHYFLSNDTLYIHTQRWQLCDG